MPFIVFAVVSLITAGIQIGFSHADFVRGVTILLAHLVFVNCGLAGLFAFVGHTVKADEIASGIGWPAGNPFQQEVAVAGLSYGVLGLASPWAGGGFMVATACGFSVFLIGCGLVHLRDLRRRSNTAVLNAGPMLYYDLIFPLLVLAVTGTYAWRRLILPGN
jgi:uncharacterized protein DUF6790